MSSRSPSRRTERSPRRGVCAPRGGSRPRRRRRGRAPPRCPRGRRRRRRPARRSAALRARLARGRGLLPAAKRRPALEHELGLRGDALEQPPVHAGHREDAAALRRSSSGTSVSPRARRSSARSSRRRRAGRPGPRCGRCSRCTRTGGGPRSGDRRRPAEISLRSRRMFVELERDAELLRQRPPPRGRSSSNTPSASRPIEPATRWQ